jgi:hypothetical protein
MTESLPSDDRNSELSAAEHARLVDLLVKAYPNKTAVGDLLHAAGVEEKIWPYDAETIGDFWRRMTGALARRGRLLALIAVAAGDPSAAAYWTQFRSFLPPGAAEAPAWSDAGVPPPTAPSLDLLAIADLPLASLPEGVRRALQTFMQQRQAYEARAGAPRRRPVGS